MKNIEIISSSLKQLSISQSLYVISILSFLAFYALNLIGLESHAEPAFSGALLFCFFGVINDLVILFKKLWDSTLGKALILLGVALSTNFSFAISSQLINSIIGVDPSKLSYALSYVSLLTIPILIGLSSIAFFVVLILLGQLYFMLSMVGKDVKEVPLLSKIVPAFSEIYQIPTMVVRLIFFTVVLSTTHSYFKNNSSDYSSFVIVSASAFIYHFEAFSKSRCLVNEGEKVIPINDKEIVVARKNDDKKYIFSLELCKPITEN
jgi:hypothetical protein